MRKKFFLQNLRSFGGHLRGAVAFSPQGWRRNYVSPIFVSLVVGFIFLMGAPISHGQIDTAPEVIHHYTSDIRVNADASLDVKETIEVTASHDQINHGIYRDFPTRYRTRSGTNVTVRFDLTNVTQDGQPAQHHTEDRSNGIRIYIGDPNALVAIGDHTYSLSYHVTRELGFFADHDELYWNVTGNGWFFPIESARATVHLPAGIQERTIQTAVFTGAQGSTAHAATATVQDGQTITFITTEELDTEEGLTIVVGWPIGFIHRPTPAELRQWWLEDHSRLIVGLAGVVLVLLYFLLVWGLVGRDPKRGTVIPQYEPPAGMSPLLMRYIQKRTVDTKSLSATIVNLAVKGAWQIHEDAATGISAMFGRKSLRLVRTQPVTLTLPPEEQRVADHIMPGETGSLALTNDHAQQLTDTRLDAIATLTKITSKQYFDLHRPYFLVGFGISMIVGVVLWLVYIPAIVFIILMNVVFSRLLVAYTALGRQTLDQIEGFKWFLSVTEEARLNFAHPPDKTPELFEKFLPYAIALGVENAWASQFTDVLAKAQYQPRWYGGGTWNNLALVNMTNGFSHSLTSAISSASTPPGGSSGFGGGFSGGGGGGGGGGGW